MTEDTHEEGKARLQDLVDSHQNGARRRSRRIVYGGLIAIGVAATLVVGLAIQKFDVSFSAAARNAEVAKAIQAERARATLVACREQNARHVRLERALDPLIASTAGSAEERAQGQAFTRLLAGALAPRRNCLKVVRASVNRERRDDGP